MEAYIERVIQETLNNNPNEPEFNQAVSEVFSSLQPVMKEHPEFQEDAILERMVEPERIIIFKVSWVNDEGKVCVNRGYRVQANGALGPYKGGLRFAPSVNLSILKFLAFEQTFKNALTGLPMGGGKGGSDFDPKGKSDREIMAFCQSFMSELYKHIGPNTDVPAGDIGVSKKEIGYLFGQYRRLRNSYDAGVLTGKDYNWGGSILRPEATGYGAVYYLLEVLKHNYDSIRGKTFVISGYGNVAWGAIKKISELGGKVLTISGSDGYVFDPDGICTEEKINYLLEMRNAKHRSVKLYADKFHCQYYPNEKPWAVEADIYMPCATQNEVDVVDAENIVENGKYYLEVSNMPTTKEAFDILYYSDVIIAPSKAVNAGGVAVSGLEMSQNALRYHFTEEEVDQKLQAIMKNIHDESAKNALAYGYGYDLVAGANITGFLKVANAMVEQGVL